MKDEEKEAMADITIEIVSQAVNERRGQTKDGREYHLRFQAAYIHQEGEKYPLKAELSLEIGQNPYPVGFYDFGGPLFEEGKYGLEFNRRVALVRNEKFVAA